ncbi:MULTISPECIES: GAP family protein [unclassified Mycolicibacterium]|uniref:GAP family protein n=1 Tax=unclassified Mycolicibacterium TaxID=2636767 RepID=UPI0012DFB420|nr:MULTISPECIES: GAP family protein [unclassified Mycolicibacterium]MUL82876.1 GAP family protein [Mycolicibacterium sp. CBMA 329]MUL89211.1 GAP family protein [Mycolicibacterium sp. CBMA 331]MUL97778.1 GAP family protein [Mycolicibacterium sp. CBMA 334]MUM29761.1 GAP family protein [Mycolicibacterium sp. CBMA 295]MUM38727.1 GAP family protein [Mycolicibacterium sp. CBMA 247]
MWGDILGMALLVSLNPVLLGFILLVISRPRPVQNLLAFWVGSLIVNIPTFVVSVLVLHSVPSFASVAQDLVTPEPGSTIKPFQFVSGVVCVVIAAVLALRLRMRKRVDQAAPVSAGGNSPVLVMEPDQPAVGEGPVGRIRGAVADLAATGRRLMSRAHDAWEGGALWVALVFGLCYIAPPPLVLMVATMVVGSGAPIGAQLVISIAFVFGMLAVFELALLSYAVAPARTQAVLQPLHEWTRHHRQLVLLVLFAVVGLWQVVTGAGLI